MIEVWHALNPTFGFGEGTIHFPNDFELVAVVNTTDLSKAFELSNTIETEWWKNEGVSLMVSRDGFRSTSVGDVLVTRDYKTHVVLPNGYKTFAAGPRFIDDKNLYKKDD
jgi:hypothetical protein